MPTIGYHFTGTKLRDGRPIPPIGKELVHEGPVKICARGLHASDTPFDAWHYAPGPILHQVSCKYVVRNKHHIDKFVCRKRTILKSIDCLPIMKDIAYEAVLFTSRYWNMPKVVKNYFITRDPALLKGAMTLLNIAPAGDYKNHSAVHAARTALGLYGDDYPWMKYKYTITHCVSAEIGCWGDERKAATQRWADKFNNKVYKAFSEIT